MACRCHRDGPLIRCRFAGPLAGLAGLAAAGIALGDGAGASRPAEPVTRGQRATFLSRAAGAAVADGAIGIRAVAYDAGCDLTQSGWGTLRALRDETFVSARFGPRPFLHGHDDHGSVTPFANGQRLLTDPGEYLYASVAERLHVRSAPAHNVVTIGDGCVDHQPGPSRITTVATDGEADRCRLHIAGCRGTRWIGDVAFRPDHGAVVVIDEVEGPAEAAKVQRWQVEVGAAVQRRTPTGAHVRWPSWAQLLVEQLVAAATADVVAGGRAPLRGWVSRRYGDLVAAPNLAFTAPEARTATSAPVLRPGASPDAPATTAVPIDGGDEVQLPRDDGEVTVIRLGR